MGAFARTKKKENVGSIDLGRAMSYCTRVIVLVCMGKTKMNSNLKISLQNFFPQKEEARPSFATHVREILPALTFSFATAKRKEKGSKER